MYEGTEVEKSSSDPVCTGINGIEFLVVENSACNPDSRDLGSVDVDENDEECNGDSNEPSSENQLKQDIICTILKALMLVEQMEGSITDFEDVLTFAKELFCRPDNRLATYWPKNWTQTVHILRDCGYKDPKELYICLDDSHNTQWDVVQTSDAPCRNCGKKGAITWDCQKRFNDGVKIL